MASHCKSHIVLPRDQIVIIQVCNTYRRSTRPPKTSIECWITLQIKWLKLKYTQHVRPETIQSLTIQTIDFTQLYQTYEVTKQELYLLKKGSNIEKILLFNNIAFVLSSSKLRLGSEEIYLFLSYYGLLEYDFFESLAIVKKFTFFL